MSLSPKLYTLLEELEQVNSELIHQLKNQPVIDYSELIAKRDLVGEKLQLLLHSNVRNQIQEELDPETQAKSQSIIEQDRELMQLIDLITYKLQSKQQSMRWRMNYNQ